MNTQPFRGIRDKYAVPTYAETNRVYIRNH